MFINKMNIKQYLMFIGFKNYFIELTLKYLVMDCLTRLRLIKILVENVA